MQTIAASPCHAVTPRPGYQWRIETPDAKPATEKRNLLEMSSSPAVIKPQLLHPRTPFFIFAPCISTGCTSRLDPAPGKGDILPRTCGNSLNFARKPITGMKRPVWNSYGSRVSGLLGFLYEYKRRGRVVLAGRGNRCGIYRVGGMSGRERPEGH